MRIEDVSAIFDHIFINEHLLEDGSRHRFYPDYDMFLSWQRLRNGKNIQNHDLTLLQHELYESQLMKNNALCYEEAHKLAEKMYNYSKELREYMREKGKK